jgi:hypothetical protein
MTAIREPYWPDFLTMVREPDLSAARLRRRLHRDRAGRAGALRNGNFGRSSTM